MNILAVDAGNTRIKWAFRDHRGWVANGAVTRQETVRLSDPWKALPVPSKIVISNVAGELIRAELTVLMARWRMAALWVSAKETQCGVTNGYRQPAQLGCDRWAALIGARHLHPGPALIVMAGTAITVDALTADGRFLGGLILPGLDMLEDAHSSKTAGIRVERGEFEAFPTSTRNAVWSAGLLGAAGAIERMRAALVATGEQNPTLILSGGSADLIEPHLEGERVGVENLVLEGLFRIADE
jgi:type III pantothenate kinase